jgi:hypothetical protein
MSDETSAPAADPAPTGDTAPTPTPEPTTPAETPAEPAKPAEGEPTEPAAAAASTDEPAEIVKARKILAAASKRAERALAREMRAKGLETSAAEYQALRAEVAKNPLALIQLGGFSDLKAYMRAVVDSGQEEKPQPSPEARRLEAIEQRIRAEDETAAAEARAERIEATQKKMFAVMDASPKLDRATGDLGHRLIWQEIEAYHAIHGDVPDAIAWMIAEGVEKYLTTEGVGQRKKGGAKPKDGAPSSLNNGMTSTSKPAPAGDDDLPMEGKARMAAVIARFGKPSAPVS